MPRSTQSDSRLADRLRAELAGEVRFDDGSRALYATDASNYRQVPIGVILPKNIEDVIAAVAICRDQDVAVLARGGGTSLAGQCCNVAVVFDFSKYVNDIVELDPESRRVRVQPGVVLDRVREQAERHTLTFGPDPATHNRCTLGGMIGNNSCGVHSLMAGKTDDNVEELEILTYDGYRLRVGSTSDDEFEDIVEAGGRKAEIYLRLKALRDRYEQLIRDRYPKIPRRVSGYNLDQLLPENGFHVARALVGSEGTCVTVLEAKLRLVHSPPARSVLVLGYRDCAAAADAVMDVVRFGPIGLEGIDDVLVDDLKRKGLHPENLDLLPAGRGWLIAEFGGDTKAEADERARECMASLQRARETPRMKLYADREEERLVWQIRESGLGATAFVEGQDPTWEGWEDSAVAPEKLGDYLRSLRALYKRFNYHGALYGHFGQGCVHTRINFDLITRAGIRRFRSFLDEASDLVLRMGGSLSGEHGDGQARGELLEKMFGPELIQAFREFKSIWDPAGRMNPGKLVDAYPIDVNLRLGVNYRPAAPKTHFGLPADNGSIAHAALRCVGVGECRKTDSGTMCPSYMVTLEERHSTRGRAHLLHEMLQGDVLHGGWRDRHVKEALDLCLACKACRRECPVGVDMATYKAEFAAHYYERRIRPRSAYAMGLVYWTARLASYAPQLVNFISQTRGLKEAVKALGGLAPERELPSFARQTFSSWFNAQRQRIRGADVILWPDTFNNHFYPETLRAGAEVLRQAGFQVAIPQRSLCCGRPLYDFGFLGLAQRQLKQIMRELGPQITAGIPIVVLEPSCAAVFRDELPNLLPNHMDARRLSRQVFLFGEFLSQRAADFALPKLEQPALLHGHCHQKSVMSMDADTKILTRLHMEFELLDSGCCGMAGSFGFERDKFEVSRLIGERVLLPRVRTASPETVIIADGFSCREQIRQLTSRRALHSAEVVHSALAKARQA
ncbi:MAG: FAD-binding and (Fe-S)-binding domain-containing protein [Gemmatimonadota bacterium]